MSQHLQIVTTVPDRETAERLARGLVDARLVACAQIAGPIVSIYRWQGVVEQAEEFQLTLKTRGDRFDAIRAYLAAHHPYDVPELLALPVVAGGETYLQWIDVNTQPSAE